MKSKTKNERKRLYAILIIVLIFGLATVWVISQTAPNPGHEASNITAGTFAGGGNYIFPAGSNVSIGGAVPQESLLYVFGNAYYSEILIESLESASIGLVANAIPMRLVNNGAGRFWIETGINPGFEKIPFLLKKKAAATDYVMGVGGYVWNLNDNYRLSVFGNLYVDGNISATGSITSPSDARLKDVDGGYEYGLSEICELSPVRFHYREGNELGLSSGDGHVGLIAQDVWGVIPEAVVEGSDGYLRLDSDPIYWAMLNAIKELKARNNALRELICLKHPGAELCDK